MRNTALKFRAKQVLVGRRPLEVPGIVDGRDAGDVDVDPIALKGDATRGVD
jgi:hypothetical protein